MKTKYPYIIDSTVKFLDGDIPVRLEMNVEIKLTSYSLTPEQESKLIGEILRKTRKTTLRVMQKYVKKDINED